MYLFYEHAVYYDNTYKLMHAYDNRCENYNIVIKLKFNIINK